MKNKTGVGNMSGVAKISLFHDISYGSRDIFSLFIILSNKMSSFWEDEARADLGKGWCVKRLVCNKKEGISILQNFQTPGFVERIGRIYYRNNVSGLCV